MIDAGELGGVADVGHERRQRRVGVVGAVGAQEGGAKTIPTSPSLRPTSRSWSSVRLRVEGHSAWHAVCEATTRRRRQARDVGEARRR